jgi:hypothetical protein
MVDEALCELCSDALARAHGQCVVELEAGDWGNIAGTTWRGLPGPKVSPSDDKAVTDCPSRGAARLVRD